MFEPITGGVNDRIDDADRSKYKGSGYLDLMIGGCARRCDSQNRAEGGAGSRPIEARAILPLRNDSEHLLRVDTT